MAAKSIVDEAPPIVCLHCGFRYAIVIDRPEHVFIECPACGYIDCIPKDLEYGDDVLASASWDEVVEVWEEQEKE